MNRWLRWLWPAPVVDEREVQRMARMKAEAAQAVADANARWPEINAAAAAARMKVTRNHIGPLIEEALRARSDPGSRGA